MCVCVHACECACVCIYIYVYECVCLGLGVALELVAKNLFDAAKKFSDTKKRTVEEVRLVLYDSKTMETIFRELKTLAEEANKKGRGWNPFQSSKSQIEGVYVCIYVCAVLSTVEYV